MSRARKLRIALLLTLGALLIAAYASGLTRALRWEAVRGQIVTWQELTRENLLLAVLVYFAVYVAVTSLTIPVALPLSLVAGALFDWWLGVAVVSVASTTGASFAFLASRYLLRDLVRRRLGPRLDRLDRGIERDGVWYLIWLRLTPVIPFFLVNVGMGLTKMSLARYAIASWVGMLPLTAVVVYAGRALGEIEKPSDVLSASVVVPLALLGAMPLVLRWAGRRLARGRDAVP